MPRNIVRAVAWGPVVVVAMASLPRPGSAQNAPARYPSMAPVEQYLMDRTAEIALARSAAPVALSRDAEVLVLGRKGYEVAAKGTNGWVCAVERSWHSPFTDAQFWNPKIRSPNCYNPPAVRTILPGVEKRSEMVLAGLSKAQVQEGIKAACRKGELPAPAPGAMSYMMSKDEYTNDNGNLAHVMFFVPTTDVPTGAGLPGTPMIAFDTPEEGMTTFIVAVGQWSDGTAAPWQ